MAITILIFHEGNHLDAVTLLQCDTHKLLWKRYTITYFFSIILGVKKSTASRLTLKKQNMSFRALLYDQKLVALEAGESVTIYPKMGFVGVPQKSSRTSF